MASLGDAWVDVHANTDPFEREAPEGIRRGAERAEDDFKDVGEDIGETITTSMGKEFKESGPKLAKSIEDGIKKQKVRTKVTVEVDKDNNVVRRWVSTITDEVEEAFTKSAAPGGPFTRIGAAISDAIGAGFNVSGKSPLIAFLIPLLGAVVGLILAAVQAAGALVAILIVLPALVGAIALEVGVVMLAFEGVGKAIKGAFAAKNTKELEEALKGLTPAAQEFVKGLLPLKQFFSDLRKLAQEKFFSELRDILPRIANALGPTFFKGFAALAAQMGRLFRHIGLFFASPVFVDFVKDLFPATIRFLRIFGPGFVAFLTGLIEMVDAALPFLTSLGQIITGNLMSLGVMFSDIAGDPAFQLWLDDMRNTLESTVELLGQVIAFLGAFMAQLNASGGVQIIDALADAFEMLSFILTSDVGKKAMEGLIHVAILSIQAFTGLLIILIGIFAFWEVMAEFWKNEFIPNFIAGFLAIGDGIINIGQFFWWLWTKIVEFYNNATRTVSGIGKSVADSFIRMRAAIFAAVAQILTNIVNIRARILAAVAGFGSLLFNAGRNIIIGLVNGIKSLFGYLVDTMGWIAGTVRNYWPFSPAKVGPLSGRGDPKFAGQKIIQRLAEGMRMEAPELRNSSVEATSNVTFGPNSIRVGFEGVVPTPQQAATTGSAVGTGILDQLAARNTRLAVRTM